MVKESGGNEKILKSAYYGNCSPDSLTNFFEELCFGFFVMSVIKSCRKVAYDV